MNFDPQTRAQLLSDVVELISGTSFVVIGFVALVIAIIRRRTPGVRAIFLVGIWSGIYGVQRLNDCSILVSLLPPWMQLCVPYSHASITYLTVVAGVLTIREFTRGKFRQFQTVIAVVGILIAIAGFGIFLLTGDEYRLLTYNQLLATVSLAVALPILSVPRLGQKYVVLQYRGVFLFGSLVFVAEAFVTNAIRPFGYQINDVWDNLGFAVYLFAIGYAALQMVYTSERRLSSIENELAIARQLQFAILPTTTPELRNLRIAAVYEPMTAVAGDFYEYLPVDEYRSGFLVADVSGHGVPAALIASMIKVAVQSVAAFADDPSELLRRLRDILSAQLQGQFVSAAYLWIDTESRIARYSAAGHPPLLCWCAACRRLARLESNGSLFGSPVDIDFPVREIAFVRGDRFLLYTDGFSEPENAAGESFGDQRVEQILHDNPSRSASELSLLLLSELRGWPPTSITQQDDVTFLVIDVL
jgi:sigma-B regulation protein RsbU (phosphoserine phosphatase)